MLTKHGFNVSSLDTRIYPAASPDSIVADSSRRLPSSSADAAAAVEDESVLDIFTLTAIVKTERDVNRAELAADAEALRRSLLGPDGVIDIHFIEDEGDAAAGEAGPLRPTPSGNARLRRTPTSAR